MKWFTNRYEKTIAELNKSIGFWKKIAVIELISYVILYWSMIIQYIYIGYIGITVILALLSFLSFYCCIESVNSIRELQETIYLRNKLGDL